MSVRNALSLAEESGIQSIAFPLIGSGTGGMSQAKVLELMTQEVESSGYGGKTVLVIFKR